MERNSLCFCGSRKKYKKCCLSLELPPFKKSKNELEIELPLTIENMPLETLVELIDNGYIQDELPFDFLAKEYPSLLNEWYPGYPGIPRYMTEDDPMFVEARVEGAFLVIPEMPDLDKIALPSDAEKFGEGECKAWIKREGDSWFATLQK